MSNETRSAQEELRVELQEAQVEPLLAVEKRLIAWSIGLGVVLLGILVWLSYTLT